MHPALWCVFDERRLSCMSINYDELFKKDSSKYHIGQLLYAPEGGIRKVSVKEIKSFPAIRNVVYMCTDCMTGESCAYNENELYPLGEREKCLEAWISMEYQIFHYKGKDLDIEKQENFSIMFPKSINVRHPATIAFRQKYRSNRPAYSPFRNSA